MRIRDQRETHDGSRASAKKLGLLAAFGGALARRRAAASVRRAVTSRSLRGLSAQSGAVFAGNPAIHVEMGDALYRARRLRIAFRRLASGLLWVTACRRTQRSSGAASRRLHHGFEQEEVAPCGFGRA